MNTTITTLKDQLITLVLKYKDTGLCITEYRRMLRKSQIVASIIGMDSGELLDEMIATY